MPLYPLKVEFRKTVLDFLYILIIMKICFLIIHKREVSYFFLYGLLLSWFSSFQQIRVSLSYLCDKGSPAP
jgi:hypothetical protein